jgi:hypothetical protein
MVKSYDQSLVLNHQHQMISPNANTQNEPAKTHQA